MNWKDIIELYIKMIIVILSACIFIEYYKIVLCSEEMYLVGHKSKTICKEMLLPQCSWSYDVVNHRESAKVTVSVRYLIYLQFTIRQCKQNHYANYFMGYINGVAYMLADISSTHNSKKLYKSKKEFLSKMLNTTSKLLLLTN